jgi:hypothetical protein
MAIRSVCSHKTNLCNRYNSTDIYTNNGVNFWGVKSSAVDVGCSTAAYIVRKQYYMASHPRRQYLDMVVKIIKSTSVYEITLYTMYSYCIFWPIKLPTTAKCDIKYGYFVITQMFVSKCTNLT